jgi:hypothetical protein
MRGVKETVEGRTFGRLTARRRDPTNPQKIVCVCECGRRKVAFLSALKAGTPFACAKCTKEYRLERALKRSMALTEKEIERYKRKEWSAAMIGERHGRCVGTILAWLRLRGVSPNSSRIIDRKRDAAVARMRKEGMTLQEIGNILGLSRERIRQLAKRTMASA